MGRPTNRSGRRACALPALVLLLPLGCSNAPLDLSVFAQGPAPLRMPSPAAGGGDCCYEEAVTGGHLFELYCGYCHNARSLAERPFSNYQNVAQHMRVRGNLTGEEYEKILAWLRRWADVPPPHADLLTPSPKRFEFSQPVSELRPKDAASPTGPSAPPQPPAAPGGMPGPQPQQP
jgi:hypothetical protein